MPPRSALAVHSTASTLSAEQAEDDCEEHGQAREEQKEQRPAATEQHPQREHEDVLVHPRTR